MRELKFRAYIKPLKRYATGLDTIQFHKCCDVAGAGIWTVVTVNEGIFGGDDIVLEQFTGLKDRNGKEIYENDIVKMPSTECAIVGYDAGSFTLECTHCTATWTMDRWCSELGLHLLDNICTSIEVIGNIHENKELLKGEE